jgi:hypothetical protein
VRLTLFHARRRDCPDRLVKIDLCPFCIADFAGPLLHMSRKAQRQLGHRLAVEGMIGVSDCGC